MIRTKLMMLFGVIALSAPAQAGPFFTGIGNLPAGTSGGAHGISRDGSTVVGTSSNVSIQPVLWTEAGGLVALGGVSSGEAVAVSADGSVITGRGSLAGTLQGFRWTAGTGMTGLGGLPGGFGDLSAGLGVSDDGTVIVGWARTSGSTFSAIRWTEASGLVDLGSLGGGVTMASGVSADGSVVVGMGDTGTHREAFRWTQETGMVGLGDLPGGDSWSIAEAVSSDGSVVVGVSESALGREAFRWTEATGMVGLGDIPGGIFESRAHAVSDDGHVIVGLSFTDVGTQAFIWDDAHGMRLLEDVLVNDYGLDLTGWILASANAISGDGLVIAGQGFNPEGKFEGWVVSLRLDEVAAVPEPGVLGMSGSALVLAGCFAACIRRRAPRRETARTKQEVAARRGLEPLCPE